MFADDAVEVAVVWGCDEVLSGVPLALRQRSYCLGATRIDNNVSMHWPFSFFLCYTHVFAPRALQIPYSGCVYLWCRYDHRHAFICSWTLSPFYDNVGTLTVPTPSVYIFFPSQPLSCIWFNLFFYRLFLMSNSTGDFFQDKIKLGSLEHTWARTSLPKFEIQSLF